MAPEPARTPGKGKPLSLKSPWTWVIIGGVALAGGAYLLWRRSKSSASSGTSSSGTSTSPDYSGALGTLQDEIGNLQSSSGYGGGSGGGTSVVPVTTPSGGGGTTDTSAGPATGDTTNSGSSSSGSSSSGSTSSSSGSSSGSTTTAVTPSVNGGKQILKQNNRATITWNGPGATQWAVTRYGPGSPNGITNIVGVPEAVYTGLAAGHNYYAVVQPLVNGKPAGKSGTIDFSTS